MAVSKPLPGRPIDPASPWARGLVNVAVGGQAGQRVINYAPNFNGVDGAGVALQSVGSPLGGAIKGNGTSAYANYGNQTRMRGTGAFTVAFRALFKTVTPGNFPTIYSVGYDGSNCGLIIGFNQNSAGNGKLWVVGNIVATKGAVTNTDFSSYLNQWFDVIVEYNGDGASGYRIEVNGVADYTTNGSGARAANGRNVYLGGLDLNGSPTRFFDGSIDYLYHWEGRTFTAAEKAALRANPWQLWPDEPQLVFAPASTQTTGTATTSQAQTADATGLAGTIGTAAASQAQSTAGTGLAGTIGAAASSQAQSAAATGLAGNIGSATSAQAQTADAVGGNIATGTATSAQTQTSSATGLVGNIGTADSAQAQTVDAVGAVDVVGAITMGQAQSSAATGNNGQTAVPHGGAWQLPAYAPQRKPLKLKAAEQPSASGATCRPRLRTVCRAVGVARSADTCRPRTRQHLRAIGASRSALTVAQARIPYNATWHAQRERDEQTLLLNL